MTNMSPFDRPYQVAPMTPGARFIRGFRRIGLVVAIAVAVAGIAFTFVVANEQNDRLQKGYTQAKCIEAKHKANRGGFVFNEFRPYEIDLDKSGCPGPMYTEMLPTILSKTTPKPAPLEGFIEPAFYGALMTAAAAGACLLLFWLLGWICAGFTRD